MTPPHWPWFAGGAALAGAVVLHTLVTRRLLGVSGHISALVDRARLGASDDGEPMDEADLIEALRAATVDAFGDDTVMAPPQPAPATPAPRPAPRPTPWARALFLVGLAAGGLASTLTAGGSLHLSSTLASPTFAATIAPWAQPLVLLLGGVLVGFGTRMSGGCTSGHGLCGMGRMQPGSALATASFFAGGVAVSLLLEAWS